MKKSIQPLSCHEGLWEDTIAQAKASRKFLLGIDDMRQFLINYPFTPDTGEWGVRRIDGCFPKQRLVWVENAFKTKKGLNCFERTSAYLAWQIVRNGIDNVKATYTVADVMINDDLRHVFPLHNSRDWVSLAKGEDVVAQGLEEELQDMLTSDTVPSKAEAIASVANLKFDDDPTIKGLVELATTIEKQIPFAYANAADIKSILQNQFEGKDGVVVRDSSGNEALIDFRHDGIIANAEPPEFTATLSKVLDPLITGGAKAATKELKDKDGNLPLKITVDQNLITIGALSLVAVLAFLGRKK